MIEIQTATFSGAPQRRDEQLDEFVELLEQAGAWLWHRGIAQWPPGSSRPQLPLLRAMVDAGALVLARDGTRLVGGCIPTILDTAEWQDGTASAATLHKLVVARPYAGQQLGRQLVRCAGAWARERGLSALRLDCWDENQALRRFYRDLGFAELHAVESHGTTVRLFEERLRRSQES